jgi:hypothetical protein
VKSFKILIASLSLLIKEVGGDGVKGTIRNINFGGKIRRKNKFHETAC